MVTTDYKDIVVEVSGQIGIIKACFYPPQQPLVDALTDSLVQSPRVPECVRRPTIARDDKCVS